MMIYALAICYAVAGQTTPPMCVPGQAWYPTLAACQAGARDAHRSWPYDQARFTCEPHRADVTYKGMPVPFSQ